MRHLQLLRLPHSLTNEIRDMMNKITEKRTAAGISRSELARQSGVPLRSLEDWEHEKTVPTNVYQLAKFARVLDCKIEN